MILRLIIRLSDWFESLPENSQNMLIGSFFLIVCVFAPTFIKSYDIYKSKKRKSEIKYKYDKETKSFVPMNEENLEYDSNTANGNNDSFIESELDVEEIISEYKTHFDIPGDYAGKYQKCHLLTKNEYHEYLKLKEYASKRNLIICPKVRLLDLIKPISGTKEYKTLLRKVMSKHIDFVICDQNLYVKAVLELDDNSHNTKNRIARDSFVNSILEDVGYIVIRTRGITKDTLSVLDKN